MFTLENILGLSLADIPIFQNPESDSFLLPAILCDKSLVSVYCTHSFSVLLYCNLTVCQGHCICQCFLHLQQYTLLSTE